MAAIYSEVSGVSENPHLSIEKLDRALEQLIQEVAEEKQQLNITFQHLHQMLADREGRLIAELDAITADISAKIEERRESLKQLTQHREETEKKLQANALNEFQEKQLSSIQNQIEKILSEQILFPRVSFNCHMKKIQKVLEDNCRIIKTPNPYIFRTLPLWNEGKGSNLLGIYSSVICIDRDRQLIYVGDTDFDICEIHIFNNDGTHNSTIVNDKFCSISSMQIHGDSIYVSSSADLYKLNKKGDIITSLRAEHFISGIFIEESDLYTCADKSLTVMVYDLNIKPKNQVTLEPISFDDKTTPCDILVSKQRIFVLFSYFGKISNYHPDPIQIFQLDGTLIRSIVTGSNIKYSKCFCLDSYENILVSDTEGDCIRIFSPEGILMQSIGEDGELESPRGISVDFKGRIIILNDKGGEIQAF